MRELVHTRRFTRSSKVALWAAVLALFLAAPVQADTASSLHAETDAAAELAADASLAETAGLTVASETMGPETKAEARWTYTQGPEASPVMPDTLEQWPTIRHPWRAAGEIVAVNAIVWAYDYYIRPDGNDGFRVGFRSWWENLSNGFEWDDNNFSTNQFAHPYHGSLYFNAARSNGFDYWESIPFTFGGSFLWEFFGETHHPSINDWIATSVGGTFLGEALFRFSQSVTDNTATGSERTWREIGGFALNPVRGFNRLMTGEASKVHANPEDRHPSSSGFSMDLGLRSVGEDQLFQTDTTRVYVDLEFEYGDDFAEENSKPFDSFNLDFQLNFGDKTGIGRVQGKGQLMRTDIKKDARSQQRIAGYHHYDYINNSAFEFAGQSFGVAHLSRLKSKSRYRVETALHANFLLLGATKSDYPNFSGRRYDYGPGSSFKLEGSFGREDWRFLRFRHEQYWIVSFNGNSATHWIAFTAVEMKFQIAGFYGLGVDYILYNRESTYDDFKDVSQRTPTLRLYMSWNG